MPKDLSSWTKVIKETVSGVSDEALQRRSWLKGGPEVFSPTEMFCQLFDDAAIEAFLKDSDNGLEREQIKAGEKLVDLMNQLHAKYPKPDENTEKLIEDSLMAQCREAAQQFLSRLD